MKSDESCPPLQHSPIWRPYTQMKTMDPPLKVVRGHGSWLYLEDNRKIFDGISSWWVTIHGHSHPLLAAALYNQASHLEHVIFSTFTHDPAEQLARKIINLTPASLTRFFYSDNGSTAVEVALKIAYQYWINTTGKARPRFIAFQNGYHGDTIGAMSVSKTSAWISLFNSLTIPCDIISYPSISNNGPSIDDKETAALAELKSLVESAPDSFSALIIEPLIQGAGGMNMCRPEFLQKLCTLCRELDILVIYDEVMTGFGRTGDLFACNKSQTEPDIICLSKGISGGCLPLGATLTSEKIFQAFYDNDPHKALYHGHSYTGNPLACATGLASLELLEADPTYYSKFEDTHTALANQYLQGNERIENLRICGTIMAFELKVENGGYFNDIKSRFAAKALEGGVLLRPLGNTVYFMPPYCTTQDEMEFVYKTISNILLTV